MGFQWIVLLVVSVLVPTSLLARRNNLPHGAYRPCALNDYSCIGNVLSRNSNCTLPVKDYVPPEFVVDDLPYETPYWNASFVEKNLIIRNFDLCYVKEFYINTLTDKAVLGIDCPQKDSEADRWVYQHRSLREDDVYRYHFRAFWPLVRFTVVMPRTDMYPSRYRVFSEVLGLPDFTIRPLDRATAIFLDSLPKDPMSLSVFEIESFFYRGQRNVRSFVQARLCDYGRPAAWEL